MGYNSKLPSQFETQAEKSENRLSLISGILIQNTIYQFEKLCVYNAYVCVWTSMGKDKSIKYVTHTFLIGPG